VRAVADGGVGARGVHRHRERGGAAGRDDALSESRLLGEAGRDEEVDCEVAARRLAHDEVAQEAAGRLVPTGAAIVGAQAERPAGVDDRLPGAVHARRRQKAVARLDDVTPRPSPVQAKDETSVVFGERELHLVAVAPRVVHAGDRLQREVAQSADVLQGLHHLALLELELRRVAQGLPLAPAARLGVSARSRHAGGRRSDDLEQPRLGVPLSAPRDLSPHHVARRRAAHEHDEVVVARDALPAVRERVDAQFEDVAGSGRHGGSVAVRPRRGERAGPGRLSTPWRLPAGTQRPSHLLQCQERRRRCR